MLANIRTFGLVALFMFGLLSLALIITGRIWQNRQDRVVSDGEHTLVRTERPVMTLPERVDISPTPTLGLRETDVIMAPRAHVRSELDTEAMRRAVFMQKRAEEFLAEGRYQEAITRFQDALEIWPQLTQVWSQLGQVYLTIQDYARARIALERAVESDPGNPHTLNDLGVSFLYLNRLETALELFETVNDIDPRFARAHFNRALVHMARDELDAADAALDAFLRLQPSNAQALKEKAYLQANRRDYEEALTTLRRALASEPDWVPLHIDLAATAALLGRVDEAFHHLDKAEAFTSPAMAYQILQQPAFREIRLTEAGRQFEQQMAERAREVLAASESAAPLPPVMQAMSSSDEAVPELP
jgi:tetratricopeptide (TPR) repeat protein